MVAGEEEAETSSTSDASIVQSGAVETVADWKNGKLRKYKIPRYLVGYQYDHSD